jgi:diguanylate cyclase (GGDEF)-like protein
VSQPVVSLEEALRLDALEAQKITDTPPDDSFDRIVRLACAALEAPSGALTFLEADRQWLKATQNFPITETARKDSFCTHTIAQDEVLVVEDAAQDPRFAENPFVTCDGGVRFYAGVPLRTREGFNIGSLCIIDQIPRKISARDRGLLRDFAAIAAHEMELRRRAGTDTLTGLYTRRLFDEIAAHEVARARRQGEKLTLAMIDIDKFKTINHSFGHPAGDAVLRAIGPVARRALRAEDQVARFGGEEIAILLPNTGLEHAAIVLDRIRRDIMAMIVPELNGRWVVTASIGVAELQPDETGIDGMLARADVALYRAKEAGRNRLELAEAA